MAIFNSYVKLPEGKIYVNPMVSRSCHLLPGPSLLAPQRLIPSQAKGLRLMGAWHWEVRPSQGGAPLVISWLKITVNYRYMSKKT